ncbi:MAG: hypothetical protein J1E05_03280 [Eubacterium sp.]|nr:hypothetical protein [Eubacterium sp.]
MTNSNDFRRYSYSADIEMTDAVNAFNLTRSSAAPKYAPAPERERRQRPLTVVSGNEKLKSKSELLSDQHRVFRQAFTTVLVLALAVSMLFAMLFTYALKNEYTREIAALKTELTREINQNICTNAELDALVTIDQIEDYAVNKLGMVKLQADQIRYIDVEKYKTERTASLSDDAPEVINEPIG